MKSSLNTIIKNELETNLIFKSIFDKFKFPNLDCLNQNLNLLYKSNEYIGYYKKEFYFDLEPIIKNFYSTGIMKLTFVSDVKDFDINKAMHFTKTNETHNVSLTFTIHNEGNTWDTERYNYTLWKL